MEKEGIKLKIATEPEIFLFNRKAALVSFLFGILCLFDVNEAGACSVCVTAMLDNILPPIGIWCLFSVIWFLSASVIVTVHNSSISGIPKLLPAILTTLISVVASLIIGPFFLLLLLLPCLFSTIVLFTELKKFRHRFAKHLKVVSSLGALCFLILIAYSGYIQFSRSDIDFALKWPYTYAGKTKFDKLYSKGSIGLEEIKEGFERAEIGAVTNLCNSLSMQHDFDKDLQLENLCNPYIDKLTE